jgi:hypothetical protein
MPTDQHYKIYIRMLCLNLSTFTSIPIKSNYADVNFTMTMLSPKLLTFKRSSDLNGVHQLLHQFCTNFHSLWLILKAWMGLKKVWILYTVCTYERVRFPGGPLPIYWYTQTYRWNGPPFWPVKYINGVQFSSICYING